MAHYRRALAFYYTARRDSREAVRHRHHRCLRVLSEGTTNLLPVCEHHHQNIQNDGWVLTLTPDRTLTIRLPDGQIMTTGPPKRSAA
jgi:hypothetical protein